MNEKWVIKILLTGYAIVIMAAITRFAWTQDEMDKAQWNKIREVEKLVLKYHLKKPE